MFEQIMKLKAEVNWNNRIVEPAHDKAPTEVTKANFKPLFNFL